MNARILSLLCFSLLTSSYVQTHAGGLPLWSRGLSFHPVDGYDSENRFSLRGITQEGLHLTGECAYYQIADQNPPVAIIEGTKTPDGDFWPDVTAQVKNEKTGKWETIATPYTFSYRSRIEVKPGELNTKLLVSLDFFISSIGKAKLGRLVLPTGGAATFELRYLLEPGVELAKNRDK